MEDVKKVYDYMIVDLNYYISRNANALLRTSPINENSYKLILKSVFTTIFRYKNELQPKRIICFLDKGPYRSLQYLPEYKANREYVQEEDVQKEQDPQEKLRLIRARKFNETVTHVRNCLRKFFAQSYLNIFYYPGMEADYLCVLMKKMFYDNEEFKDKKAVLLSSDSDWITFRSSQIDYYKTGRTKNILFSEPSEEEVKFMDNISPDLYKMGILRELFKGSHNNVPKYPHKVKSSIFCDQMCNPDKYDEKIPDFEEYKKYFDALDPLSKFYNNTEVLDLMKKHFLKDQTHDIRKIDDYFYLLGFNPNVIKKYISLGDISYTPINRSGSAEATLSKESVDNFVFD